MKSQTLDLEKNLEVFHRIIVDYLRANESKDTPVVEARSPSELLSLLDLDLPKDGKALSSILGDTKIYLDHSVRTGHPQFLNQLFGGFSFPGFLGESLAALSNTSMYTQEVAPLATLIEKKLIQKMLLTAGFERGEGIFTTGGSNSNLVALLAARHRIFPEGKDKGLRTAPRLTLFVSDESHYSLSKAAGVLGLGTEACVKVPTDENGRMTAEALEHSLQKSKREGMTPFFVCATAGTTVRGAFDPISPLAEIAKTHGLWLHVDGSWGASVLLSKKHRRLMDGIEKADSLAWDAHKMMGAPLVASVILLNHKKSVPENTGLLRKINDTSGTDYLFHAEDAGDSVDLGQISLQCGRRVDALKLWLLWRHLGDSGFEKNIDRIFDLAAYARKKIMSHPRLTLMDEPMSLNLCFCYVPEKSCTPPEIDEINIKVRDRLYQSGKAVVNYARLRGRAVIRLIVVNFSLEENDLDRFFEAVVSEGEKLRGAQ